MSTKSANSEIAFTINEDNWQETINILKNMFTNITDPDLKSKEIRWDYSKYKQHLLNGMISGKSIDILDN